WNAKHSWWGNQRSCKRGRTLLETIHNSKNLNILATGGATHYPYDRRKNPSAIDFAIYSGIDDGSINTFSNTDLDSDHLPIQIKLNLAQTPYEKVSKNKLDTKHMNVNKF
ncbi:hypothetical protein KR215_010401, partial [Drosophila sulfurigaster]